MKPTKSSEKISASILEQIGIKTKTAPAFAKEMPVCEDCLQHRKKAAKTKWLVVLPAVAAAAASVPIYMLANGNSNGAVFWPIPFIIAVVAYLILGFVFRLPELSAEHSTRQKSVQLSNSGQKDNKTTYTFTNWHYAKIFAAANHAAVTETPRRNRAKSLRFIKTIDYR